MSALGGESTSCELMYDVVAVIGLIAEDYTCHIMAESSRHELLNLKSVP